MKGVALSRKSDKPQGWPDRYETQVDQVLGPNVAYFGQEHESVELVAQCLVELGEVA
jgi:hypothetical protein